MKNRRLRLLILISIFAAAASAWLYGYHHHKNLDNIPSKALMLTYLEEKGEGYASAKIEGYSLEGLCTVWGEPDGTLFGMFGCIWEIEDTFFVVYFDSDSLAEFVKLGERSEGH